VKVRPLFFRLLFAPATSTLARVAKKRELEIGQLPATFLKKMLRFFPLLAGRTKRVFGLPYLLLSGTCQR